MKISLAEFEAKLREDEQLRAAFKEALEKSKSADPASILAAAAALGYELPEEDFEKELAKAQQAKLQEIEGNELSEDELKAVTGGKSNPDCLDVFKRSDYEVWCYANWACSVALKFVTTKCEHSYECNFDYKAY